MNLRKQHQAVIPDVSSGNWEGLTVELMYNAKCCRLRNVQSVHHWNCN